MFDLSSGFILGEPNTAASSTVFTPECYFEDCGGKFSHADGKIAALMAQRAKVGEDPL